MSLEEARPSQSRSSNPGVEDSNASYKSVEGNTNDMQTLGHLRYRLVGFLVLQSLYASLVNKYQKLEAENAKLIRAQSSKTEFKKVTDSNASARFSSEQQESEGAGEVLVCRMCRTMQETITKYEKRIAHIENKTFKGIVQQYYELEQSYQHRMRIQEEMEREIEVYRTMFPSTRDEGDTPYVPDQELVRNLIQTQTQLSVERTLAQELGVQLRQKTEEVDALSQQLQVQIYGRRQAQGRVCELLNEFVCCCLAIPTVVNEAGVMQCFEELLVKIDDLSEFDKEITAAVQVALQEVRRSSLLYDAPEEAQIDLSSISLAQAVDKITELQTREKRLRRDGKREVIEQMRKHKQAAMKNKDLEERLQKSNADRLLSVEQLRDENSRLRVELNEHHQTLGRGSSYAARVAESVRSLVDLIETQKFELQSERDRLSGDLSDLRQSHDEMKRSNQQLKSDVRKISATALETATATVKEDLDRLESECSRLRDENRDLVERLEFVEDAARQDREKSRSLVETVETLEPQIRRYESEVRELQKINAVLTETKQKMGTKINALEKTLQSFMSERQTTTSRQPTGYPFATAHRSLSGVSYGDRESHQLSLVSRSPSPPQSLSSLQHTDQQTRERITAAVSLAGDAMTQSLPPSLSSSNPGSFRVNRPDDRVSRLSTSESRKSFIYSRDEASSKPIIRSTTRDTMQCLRCGSRFSVVNLDEYEKHIKACYSDVNVQ